MMNLKQLRHHGSIITPPPPVESPAAVAEVLVRYFVDGVTPVDTIADGSQTFPFPDGPFYYIVLRSDGGNPPELDWVFDTYSEPLYNSLSAETQDLGGGLTTAAIINLAFGVHKEVGHDYSIYNDPTASLTTFEAQAYERNLTFPLSRTYGPLLTFACQPALYDPFFQTGTWYVNRYSRNGGFHQISGAGLELTYPAGWGTAEEVSQGNLILLASPSITWGTLSRLTWQITQLSGTTRKMSVFGFPYQFSDGVVVNGMNGQAIGIDPSISGSSFEPKPRLFAINDFSPDLTASEWASGWFTSDAYISSHPFNSFVFVERFERGMNYSGTAYQIQAQFNAVDFGDPIIISCEA